jgi:AraC-like DNA-binding protein
MEKIRILLDCLSALHRISLFEFSTDGSLLWTDHPDSRFLDSTAFSGIGRLAFRYANRYSKPSIVAGAYHCMWIIDSLRCSDVPERIYVVGPFFMDSYPEAEIKEEIRKAGLASPEKRMILKQLPNVSVIPFSSTMNYAIMIHYAITGEKISIMDLHHKIETAPVLPKDNDEDLITFHGTYEAEKEMLEMVRTGDLRLFDYLKGFELSRVGILANTNSEPLRQIKNTSLAGIVLFSRAAIDGGLYPDTAMTLTDRYFQAVEACRTFQDVGIVTEMMQKDFVNRVHKIRHQQGYTKPVQAVFDYIDLHLEEEILLKQIAAELGYTEYYLSRRFRNEVGVSIKQHIRNMRLERAASLLRDPLTTVKEISERLHFASESYFIDCFRQKYGMTPKVYQQST